MSCAGSAQDLKRRAKELSPRLPSKIKSVNSHQVDEVASRIIAKKVIASGSRNSVNNNIERELNIRNPREEPM
jgi:hypothetical protein